MYHCLFMTISFILSLETNLQSKCYFYYFHATDRKLRFGKIKERD